MSTWEELGTTSTKILNDLPNLKKGHRQKTDGVTAKVTTREACASKNTRKFGLSLSFCNTYKNAMESDNRLVNEDSLEDNFRHLLVVSNIFLFVVVINCK